MTLRLLAIHAHPDDESSKGAATCAYYRARGARVAVVTCTGGERGSVLSDALPARARHHAERDMAGLRRLEMATARDLLGVEHHWLGYEDSGLPAGDEAVPDRSFATIPIEVAAEPLVRIVRELRPHVIVSYDEIGGYPHPDHIRTHEIAMHAWHTSGDATQYPDAGEPWQVQKFYYDRMFNPGRARALQQLLDTMPADDPIVEQMSEMVERMSTRPDRVTTRVPSGDYFEVRDAALRAHASQVSPDSRFFFWPNERLRELWPTEDFELAHSRVPATTPEDDLFAGIVDEETS